MSTAASGTQATDTLVERFGLKALVESCLVIEEGVAGAKDVDLGMMAGAGIMPGPLQRADERGDAAAGALLVHARACIGVTAHERH